MIRIIFFTLLWMSVVHAQITFSEVMFDLEGADYHDEFIEIYNLSETETVDLTGWYLSDSNYIDDIIETDDGMLLSPLSYAVILDGSYFENSTLYDNIIPDSALIITIDGGAFSLNGLTNTVPKTLMLCDADSHLVDSYRYSIDNEPSHSDEKILMNSDNSISNWGNSLVKPGTPGFRNSISPHQFDLGFSEDALSYHPSILIRTLQSISIECEITNTGLENFYDSIDIQIYVDRNKDSVFNDEDEVLIDENIDIDLISTQIMVVQTNWTPLVAGTFSIVALLQSDLDQNPNNNLPIVEIKVIESRETVIPQLYCIRIII
ncbi:MAG: lamin tail domain-containing protein [Calditrichaceae bacterium]